MAKSFVQSKVQVALAPAPITPGWILEGSPTAQAIELSRSDDGTAVTYVWECTPGRFNWHYNRDETLLIIEGLVILDEGLATERRIGPGDVVFFPSGAEVQWRVELTVRKLAFTRRALPQPVAKLANMLRALRRRVRPRQQIAMANF